MAFEHESATAAQRRRQLRGADLADGDCGSPHENVGRGRIVAGVTHPVLDRGLCCVCRECTPRHLIVINANRSKKVTVSWRANSRPNSLRREPRFCRSCANNGFHLKKKGKLNYDDYDGKVHVAAIVKRGYTLLMQ